MVKKSKMALAEVVNNNQDLLAMSDHEMMCKRDNKSQGNFTGEQKPRVVPIC